MTDKDITIRHPKQSDQQCFIDAMQASQQLHDPWLDAPRCADSFQQYLGKYESDANISYIVLCNDAIAGVININEIVRGCFLSAYLGYFAAAEFAGKGIMRQGLCQVIRQAFTEHGLHRLEANIQPANTASINLVKRCGFEKEGFSKAYLKINGVWCDHERWAIRNDMLVSDLYFKAEFK